MISLVQKSEDVRLFGTASIMLSVRVVGTLLTLTYTLLMVAVAPPDEVGRAFAALSTGFLLSVVASLNIEAGSIRFLPLYLETDRAVDAAGFVFWCRRTVLVICATVMVPVSAIMIWIYGLDAMGPFVLSFAAAPIMANARINSRQGVALGLVLRASLPRVLVRPLVMVAFLGTATVMGWTLTATHIMAALCVAAAFETGLQWAFIRHTLAFRRAVPARFDQARAWVPFGLMLSPMLVMQEYLRDVIIMTAGFVLLPGDVAKLGISLSMIGILNFALNAFDLAFSPKISRAIVQGNSKGCARLLTLCGVGKLGVLMLGVPLAWVFIPLALDVMGADYAGIETMFLVLVIIPASRAVFGPANLVLNVTGHKQVLFWCALAGAGAILLGVFVGEALAETAGVIIGAAVAVASYQTLLFTMCRWHTRVDTTALSLMWERRKLEGAFHGPDPAA
ncbi:MAG: hypothetical protein AAGL19_03935 [Pseudomonadota bacterium]